MQQHSPALLSFLSECINARQRCFFGAWKKFVGRWESHERKIGNHRDCCVKLLDLETKWESKLIDLYLKDVCQWNHCRPKRFKVYPHRALNRVCLHLAKLTSFLSKIIILLVLSFFKGSGIISPEEMLALYIYAKHRHVTWYISCVANMLKLYISLFQFYVVTMLRQKPLVKGKKSIMVWLKIPGRAATNKARNVPTSR